MATVMALAPMTVITIDNDYASDGVVERSGSTSSATMACRRKKRIFFFYFVFFLLLFSFSSSSSKAGPNLVLQSNLVCVCAPKT